MLEAQGHFGRKEIAEAVGVNVTTIAMWRRLPAYREMIDYYVDRDAQEVSKFIERLRNEVVDGAIEAVIQLRDALEAVTKDGTPNWNVRLRAAELLLNKAMGEVPRANEGLPAGGGSSITFVLEEGSTMKVAQPEPKKLEDGNTIEGTARETGGAADS